MGFSWGTRPTSAPATSSSGSTGNSSTTNINASVYIGNDVSTYTEGNYTYGTGVSYDNIYVDIGSNLARFLVPSNETENSTTGIYEDERFPGVQIISNVPGSFSVNESRKRRSQPVKRAAPQLITPTSSIGDAIAEAFATLQQAVNNAISNGVQQIENVAADIQNLASVTTQSAQRIAINGLAEINTIMSNVTDGFSACAEAAGNLFIGPIRVAQNDAEKCISDKVNEALNITANTLASLQDALSGVEKIQAEIDACAALNNSNFLTEEFVRSSCYATVNIYFNFAEYLMFFISSSRFYSILKAKRFYYHSK